MKKFHSQHLSWDDVQSWRGGFDPIGGDPGTTTFDPPYAPDYQPIFGDPSAYDPSVHFLPPPSSDHLLTDPGSLYDPTANDVVTPDPAVHPALIDAGSIYGPRTFDPAMHDAAHDPSAQSAHPALTDPGSFNDPTLHDAAAHDPSAPSTDPALADPSSLNDPMTHDPAVYRLNAPSTDPALTNPIDDPKIYDPMAYYD